MTSVGLSQVREPEEADIESWYFFLPIFQQPTLKRIIWIPSTSCPGENRNEPQRIDFSAPNIFPSIRNVSLMAFLCPSGFRGFSEYSQSLKSSFKETPLICKRRPPSFRICVYYNNQSLLKLTVERQRKILIHLREDFMILERKQSAYFISTSTSQSKTILEVVLTSRVNACSCGVDLESEDIKL
ncbi:hypothetical protein AVEN_83813-1 [Araneus ventricosus]|nr:hypothetical protein AVEN_83813-1 [Araneus ventricosus]